MAVFSIIISENTSAGLATELEGRLLERDCPVERIDPEFDPAGPGANPAFRDLNSSQKNILAVELANRLLRNHISVIIRVPADTDLTGFSETNRVMVTKGATPDQVIAELETRKLITPLSSADYSSQEDRAIQERLRGLGYIE